MQRLNIPVSMTDLFLTERGGEAVVLKRYKEKDAISFESERAALHRLNP